MRYALAYGADAVYAGQPRYSLRVRNNTFNKLENLKQGIDEAHALGKQFFLASNIAPHNDKVKTYLRDLAPVIALAPDALIMSDPGLIMMVRETWPDMDIHLSVQSNVVNFAAVKFWQKQGIKRIILSRELALEEVAEIRQLCPDIELEVFVHGALCIAYSGRCLLSGYFNHRDPNQGACTNACRWNYSVSDKTTETDTGDIIKAANIEEPKYIPPVIIEEANRPGEHMVAEEDEHGSYIMNSKDLRAIEHVHTLAKMGVDSLKIEGRTKSHYYVARTAQLYRQAIDDAVSGNTFNPELINELNKLANRGYTEGFYRRHIPHDELQNYSQSSSANQSQKFVGEIIDQSDDSYVVEVKNKFKIGDEMELITTSGNIHFMIESMQNTKNEAMEIAPGSGHTVIIPKPQQMAGIQHEYAMLAAYQA